MVKLLENILGSKSKVAVLRVLINSKIGYSGSEISRRSGKGLLSIQNALADLEGCGLLDVHRGKVEHRYRLNRDHYLVAHGLRQLFASEGEMMKSLARHLTAVLDGKVVAAGLFGSAARGEARPGSDIDLIVIVESKKEYHKVSRLLLDPVERLSKQFGWPVQLVIYLRKDLSNGSAAKKGLLREVASDWIPVVGGKYKDIFPQNSDHRGDN
jgi:predicted nucleotidyltransferase